MASYNVVSAKHATLTGTTADTISFTQVWGSVEITNYDSSNKLYFTSDGTVPTAAADNTGVVPVSSSVVVSGTYGPSSAGGASLKIVGSGGAYSVVGFT